MDQTSASTLSANTLHCALELSKKSWLLAIGSSRAFIKSKAGHRKADGEARCSPGLLGQGERRAADDHALL